MRMIYLPDGRVTRMIQSQGFNSNDKKKKKKKKKDEFKLRYLKNLKLFSIRV